MRITTTTQDVVRQGRARLGAMDDPVRVDDRRRAG